MALVVELLPPLISEELGVGGVFWLCAWRLGELQHIRNGAHEFDLKSTFDRPHDYALDQAADELQCLGAYRRGPGAPRADARPCACRGSQVGVQPGRGRRCAIQAFAVKRYRMSRSRGHACMKVCFN